MMERIITTNELEVFINTFKGEVVAFTELLEKRKKEVANIPKSLCASCITNERVKYANDHFQQAMWTLEETMKNFSTPEIKQEDN